MGPIIRNVTALDDAQRRALEDVIGRELRAGETLEISVLEGESSAEQSATVKGRSQSLADWTSILEELSDDQIEQIDKVAKTRAKLTRHAQ